MLQFTIRDLLVLMTFCALAFGWWADHRLTTHAIKVKDQAIGILLTNRIDQFRQSQQK